MNKDYLELSDFDYGIYRNYPDLKLMSKSELENHFITHGIEEGRISSQIRNRNDFVNLIEKKGKMLEIGPLDNPQLDYLSSDYYSIDVFSKEQLIKNYINDLKVNKEKIIDPSYIIADNDYSQIKEKFNCIFSSHNIEHMPCLITFLNNLGGLLARGGYIYLIVPDKRYCFDHFKRESDIYDVLQLFHEKNSRPRLSDVLKMVSQGTHNDCVAHWNNDHGFIDLDSAVLQSFQGIVDQYNTGAYIDSHVSFFTPQSFMGIIGMLNRLKLTSLEIHKIFHTVRNSNEFYVILKNDNL